ncbi:MAG TPA: hypothetical protein DCY88_25685 [Cyanobacteria bacterium UBA11372]|nr:hypothetical protein [Cyanobacteria bacterium UBA11372]
MKTNSKRKWIYLFLGTTVTVVLLSWALRDVSFTAVWNALKSAQPGWLFLGWLAYISSYGVRARRWGTLLGAHCQPGRFKIRLCATFIGFGASCILPAQAGEFIRPAILSRFDGLPFATTFGSIFVERLLDIGVVLVLLLIPLWSGRIPQSSTLNQFAIGGIAILLVLVWVTFLIAASFPDTVARLAVTICQKFGLGRFESKVESSAIKFLGGLSALRQPKRTLTALVETFFIWALNGIIYWTGLLAFGIPTPGFLGALFIQSSTALAIALPSSPGYIGPFEAGIRFALSLYSTPSSTVIAYAIALRFLMMVTIPIIGLAIATKLGLSLTEITSKKSLTSGYYTSDKSG